MSQRADGPRTAGGSGGPSPRVGTGQAAGPEDIQEAQRGEPLAAPRSSATLPSGTGPIGEQPDHGPRGGEPRGETPPSQARRGARPVLWDLAVLASFLAAGVAATWPRASYLTGRLPMSGDQAQYVWNMWWAAHQVTHLGNPWFSSYLAAPVGVHLGFDTLTPLLGVLMTPVTLAFGPSASYTLISVAVPGLAAYAMYRAARLWLPSRLGAVAAGAFFGLSGMVTSQAWYHIHTAVGTVFLPMTLEAAVRLRRRPGIGRGVILGVVVGATILVDQESMILAAVVAALALAPWLVRVGASGIRATTAAVAAAVVAAGPQLAAMVAQVRADGGPTQPPRGNYIRFAAELPSLFTPSPRLRSSGMSALASAYHAHTADEMIATYGLVLSLLALLGLVTSWRRHGSARLALLWLGCSVLALGPTLYLGTRQFVPLARMWHGAPVSLLMPYTWLIRVPGFTAFREADRIALLGLVGAALLAGAGVEWLRSHARPLIIVVAAAGALEAGWPGNFVPFDGRPQLTMPTTMAALDRPIAADHSRSVVVDVPFEVRGPRHFGNDLSPYALMLAAADGHPRGDAYTSWISKKTIKSIRRHPFYAGLVAAATGKIRPARIAAARRDLRRLHVGWVLVWPRSWAMAGGGRGLPAINYRTIYRYLAATGLRFDDHADGVQVYRPGG